MMTLVTRFAAGQPVQTPLGKGVIREVRNGGRFLVDIQGRSVVLKDSDVSEFAERRRRPERRDAQPAAGSGAAAARSGKTANREVDLHGLTVADALLRAEHALNDALLADFAELRLIHGRTGGRIRAALHRRLREIPSVRAFELDPRNEGVTVVHL